jgi:serine/threonine protein kinase
VVHGNIKPANVFVAADGRMLLSDFGIARGYDDSQQSLTVTIQKGLSQDCEGDPNLVE